MFERICPWCNTIITYTTKGACKLGNKNNSVCVRCRSVKSGFLQKYATKGVNTGESNNFYGKKHSLETKEKIKKANTGRLKSVEELEKLRKSSSGCNNPMFGKKVFDVWVEKYGEIEAIEKFKEWKEKQKRNAKRGKDNHQYGKPAPQGSGNGWKGWYKNWFFRSLRELSYMIDVIEKNNYKWKTAECRDLMIQYIDFEGNKRNYFADFIINDKEMIEIKPIRLHNSDNVIRKKEAGIKFCKENGLIYKLVDCDIINVNNLKKLVDSKIVIFTNRYKERVDKYFKENINE